MSEPLWRTTTRTKRLVRVGNARWVDPAAIEAVEPTSAGKIRFHLAGGGTFDLPVPSTEGIEAYTEKVLRGLFREAPDA